MNIRSEIMRLALPAIISNITTPLLGLADTAVTGHMGGAAFIGAIAIGGSMFSLAYWALNFLRMGTSGLTAQSYGLSHGQLTPSSMMILWRSLLMAFLLSAILIILSPLLASALLAFLHPVPEVSALARQYFMIVIFGAPAVLGTYALSGWFLGMQDAKSPMWMAILTNISNIALSVTFVFAFGWGMTGVALGTLLAQWLGLFLGIAFIIKYMKKERAQIKVTWAQLIDRKAMMRFLSVNTDIFFRTLCLAAVTLWFTRAGSQLGPVILAANAILMQLFILFSYFMDGFAFAGEALAGKYHNNRQSLNETVKSIFQCGFWLAVAFTLLYAFGGKSIIWALTDDKEIVTAASDYMAWAVAVPIVGTAAFAWDGIFIGLTRTRQMLLSMAIATAAFFVFCFALTSPLGNHGLWIAFLTYLFLRGATQTLFFFFPKAPNSGANGILN